MIHDAVPMRDDTRRLLLSTPDFQEVRGDGCIWRIARKFGRALIGTAFTNVSSTLTYPVPNPLGAVTLEFLSSDANDTFLGTGLRTLEARGISADGSEFASTIPLNGTSPSATTVPNVIRLFRMKGKTTGTYASNTVPSHFGTITARVAGGGTTWGQIVLDTFAPGATEIAAFTTSIDWESWVEDLDVGVSQSGSTKTAELRVFTRENILETVAPFTGVATVIDSRVGVSSYSRPYLRPFYLPPLTDFAIGMSVASGTAYCTGSFTIIQRKIT